MRSLSIKPILYGIMFLAGASVLAEEPDTESPIHKVIILGSGPAGLSAGIFAARAQMEPLILDGSRAGGHLMSTTGVNNWPGTTSILGPDLVQNMREHAELSGCELLPETAIQVDLSQTPFTIITDSGRTLKTYALIIAVGSVPRRLGCPGEDTYWGRGVSVCVTCDGLFYKDKEVIVVGGGDSALEFASVLSKYARSVTIIQNLDYLTASAPMQQRLLSNTAIKEVIFSSAITAIQGDLEGVTAVTIKNKITGDTREITTDGVFLAIGHSPDTAIFRNQLAMDRFGVIQTHDFVKTSVAGVFAAGDVMCPLYKQAICAAGTGCMAALAAERYLLETKQHRYKFEKN